jgi:hypothetical protein
MSATFEYRMFPSMPMGTRITKKESSIKIQAAVDFFQPLLSVK